MKNTVLFAVVLLLTFLTAGLVVINSTSEETKNTIVVASKDNNISVKSVESTGFAKVTISVKNETKKVSKIRYHLIDGTIMSSENWKPYPEVNIYTPGSALFSLQYGDGTTSPVMNFRDYLQQ